MSKLKLSFHCFVIIIYRLINTLVNLTALSVTKELKYRIITVISQAKRITEFFDNLKLLELVDRWVLIKSIS